MINIIFDISAMSPRCEYAIQMAKGDNNVKQTHTYMFERPNTDISGNHEVI